MKGGCYPPLHAPPGPRGCARLPAMARARYQPGPAPRSAQPLPSPSPGMPSCYLLSSQHRIPRHPETNAAAPPPSPASLHPYGNPPPLKSHSPFRQPLLLPAPTAPPLLRSAGLCFSGLPNFIYFPDGFPGFPLPTPGRASSESRGLPGCGHAPTGGAPSTPPSPALGHPPAERIFLFSGHLQPWYELSTPGGTFPSYFMGQNQEGSPQGWLHGERCTIHSRSPGKLPARLSPRRTPAMPRWAAAPDPTPLCTSEELQNTRHPRDRPCWISASRAQQPQPACMLPLDSPVSNKG